MRIDVEKVLLIGPIRHKEAFYARLQELGVVEIIPLRPMEEEEDSEVTTTLHALHILRGMPTHTQAPLDGQRSSYAVAQAIVETKSTLEQMLEKERILNKEIARIAPFGDFSFEELRTLEKESGRRIQFYFAKEGKAEEEKRRPEVISINRVHEIEYFMAVNPEPTSYPHLIEMTFEKSLSELQTERAEVQKRIDEAQGEIALFTRYRTVLREGLALALNRVHLTRAQLQTEAELEERLFSAYAWIPIHKRALLEESAEKEHIYVASVAIGPEERIPTYLENKGVGKLGEDLVGIYDVPSPTDRDPSTWVFFAFGLFFSIIIGDAGYGLLLLLISLFLLKKFGKKGGALLRVLQLSTYLSIGCIIWGVMAASFFGITLPPDSSLRKLSFVDWMVKKKVEYLMVHKGPLYESLVKEYPEVATATNPMEFLLKGVKIREGSEVGYTVYTEFSGNVMLEIALFIGALHIFCSLLRYGLRNWANLGWAIFMVGAYLYFPMILRALSLIHYLFGVPLEMGALVGKYLVFGGIALASLLGLIQKRLGGLAEVTQVIGVFADVMSYLRIYALALAGAILGSTFNDMAAKAPLILGLFILFAGHTVNFVLALGGGLIHGLRLNFIEWYHYSFEGGGRSFSPLRNIKLE